MLPDARQKKSADPEGITRRVVSFFVALVPFFSGAVSGKLVRPPRFLRRVRPPGSPNWQCTLKLAVNPRDLQPKLAVNPKLCSPNWQ